MLTDTQKSMIVHHIGRLINVLMYPVRLSKNNGNFSSVAAIIQKAIDDDYRGLPYVRNSVNTGYDQGVIARELNGIFNPDFQVLQTLAIINNPRETTKIPNENALQKFSNEIRLFALQTLQKYFSMGRYPNVTGYIDHQAIASEVSRLCDHSSTLLTPS